MTSKNDPATDPGELTVGELRAALQDRHGNALADTDTLLQSVTVDCAKTDVAAKMERATERLQAAARRVDTNYPGTVHDPDDPLKSAHAAIVELIQMFGVAEVLHGRGAKRVRKG